MEDIFHRVLKALDEEGLWDRGVELIGSWSYLMYQRHLGAPVYSLRTQDADFLVPWPYRGETRNLSAKLAEIGFRPAVEPNGAVSFQHPELKIEFLVPERGKGGQDFRLIAPLGLKAIPLRFLDMLLKDSILIEREGVRVRVPHPAAYAIHKLLIAQRRAKKEKKLKDIEQAVLTLAIVEPGEISARLKEFPSGWKSAVMRSLREAWDLRPLERGVLSRHGFTPQK